jgi:DNA-binding transcriptional MerR regulator
LSKEYGLSRKTFERWDKEGKLVPERINGIRYYNEKQKQIVPKILFQNNSPKMKALLASSHLALR